MRDVALVDDDQLRRNLFTRKDGFIDLHLNWFASRPSTAKMQGLLWKPPLVNLNKSQLPPPMAR
jgi:hypothetical protein